MTKRTQKPRIYLVTQVHEGLRGHREMSGDQKSFAFGPRGYPAALNALRDEISTCRRNLGDIGAGRSWLELRDSTGICRFGSTGLTWGGGKYEDPSIMYTWGAAEHQQRLDRHFEAMWPTE